VMQPDDVLRRTRPQQFEIEVSFENTFARA
jgi:hypothetical protein